MDSALVTPPFSRDEWDACIKVLRAAADDPSTIPDVDLLKGLATRLYRDARKERRRSAKEEKSSVDRATMEATLRCRQESLDPTPLLPERTAELTLLRAANCYICKAPYTAVDAFYHLLCPECAAKNHAWRVRRTDLTGRRALVTGGRIKIGHHVALKLLRDGAEVIVTTRFPYDAMRRFASEADFTGWQHRLRVVQLDLLNLPAVERFAEHLLAIEPHLDLLINNAAQTIRRPPEYYAALRAAETQLALANSTPKLSLAPEAYLFSPVSGTEPHAKEFDGEPLDFRARNSWILNACEIETTELLETHLVGAFAPFILNTRLRPLMNKSLFAERFIVNVSAMEGQFGRKNKTERHPHTNMAKAALNMLTRTSAAEFARDAIYMNSVDTGWITNENPRSAKREQRASGFVPPLDVIDGAARIYAPIISGVEGSPVFGKFLKDYAEHEW
jgi:NAD(P)-dependent dehydrogenase (short-subunit alcohol dehydrogenase family)